MENTRYLSTYGLGEGITFAEGASVVVEGNALLGNSRSGVAFMAPASGTISGNTVSDNSAYGILEFCVDEATSTVQVFGNAFTNNALGDTLLCTQTQ